MPEQHPLQKLLQQLKQFLEQAEDRIRSNPQLGPPPPGIEEQVKDLERRVHEFKELNEQLVAKVGLTQAELKNTMLVPHADTLIKDSLILQQANDIVLEARRIYNGLGLGIQMARRARARPRKRKGKFDRLGMKKNWKVI